MQLAQGIYKVCLNEVVFNITTSNSSYKMACVSMITIEMYSESTPSNKYKSQVFLKIMSQCILRRYYEIFCKLSQ